MTLMEKVEVTIGILIIVGFLTWSINVFFY